jgi:hypothetical protein
LTNKHLKTPPQKVQQISDTQKAIKTQNMSTNITITFRHLYAKHPLKTFGCYKTKGKLAINFTHPEAKATVDEKTSQNSTPKSSTNFRYSKSHKNPKYVH